MARLWRLEQLINNTNNTTRETKKVSNALLLLKRYGACTLSRDRLKAYGVRPQTSSNRTSADIALSYKRVRRDGVLHEDLPPSDHSTATRMNHVRLKAEVHLYVVRET